MRFGRAGCLALLCVAFSVEGCHCGSPLQGISGEAAVSPQQIDFGTVTLGQSVKRSITIQNMGGVSLVVGPVSFTGANPMDYALTPSVNGKAIAPGQSIATSVVFTPLDVGARTATLQISTDSRLTPTLSVSLTGNGIDIQVCAQPASLDFGSVQVLGTPVSQQVVLQNCGKSPAQITVGAVEGAQSGDFSVTGGGSTATTVPAGQSLTLTIAYRPHLLGPSTADVPYTVCATCAPAAPIGLSGIGVDGALTLTPNPVVFGQVDDGQTGTQTVTATNNGTAAISITTLAVNNNPSPFAVASPPTLPASLAPGQSLTLHVTYDPAAGATGAQQDALDATFAVADPAVAARAVSDSLQGTAVQPPCQIQVTPATLAYGSVLPNHPLSRQVTIQNTGGLVCNITSIGLGAGTDPLFSLVSGTPASLTIAPGASSPIGVQFAPAAATAPLNRTGTLTFASDDPAHATNSVPLSASINNSVYSGGWPKWHFDNFNSGQTQADTSALTGTVAWKHLIGPPSGATGTSTYINSPVVDTNGNVYQVSMAGVLNAVSAAGAKLWTTTVADASGDPHPSTPAILASGSLFVAAGSDALNTGKNLFYISSAGALLASQTFGEDGFDACPALSNDGTLFLADDDAPDVTDPSSAVAFKASGTTITKLAGLALPLTEESERFGIVIAQDDTTYWGNNGQFFAVTPPSAGFKQVTAWPSGGVTQVVPYADINEVSDIISDVALDAQVNNHLYVYSAWEDMDLNGNYSVQGVLSALNPSSGSTAWTLSLPSANLPTGWNSLPSDSGNAAPAVAFDGTVYVGNGDGLRAVDGASGVVNWLFSSANVSSSPAIGADGTVFFGCSDGNFYAVHPNGTVRFKIKAGGPISSSPAIATDGSVYFIADDGNLYAVH